jgi:hypothetical protein
MELSGLSGRFQVASSAAGHAAALDQVEDFVADRRNAARKDLRADFARATEVREMAEQTEAGDVGRSADEFLFSELGRV